MTITIVHSGVTVKSKSSIARDHACCDSLQYNAKARDPSCKTQLISKDLAYIPLLVKARTVPIGETFLSLLHYTLSVKMVRGIQVVRRVIGSLKIVFRRVSQNGTSLEAV